MDFPPYPEKGVNPMSSFSTILDPTFEDFNDPFKYYDLQGEPLEDKLYLPYVRCAQPQTGAFAGLRRIDPAKKELGVVFVHPYPHSFCAFSQFCGSQMDVRPSSANKQTKQKNNEVLEKKIIENLTFPRI
jgi:hypothetical protein